MFAGEPSSANRNELELICHNLLIPAHAFDDMTKRGEKDVVWLTRDEAMQIGQTITELQVAGMETLTKGQQESANAAIALLKPKRLRQKNG